MEGGLGCGAGRLVVVGMTEFLALCRNSSRRAPHVSGGETVPTQNFPRRQRTAPDRGPHGGGRQVQFDGGLGDGEGGHQGLLRVEPAIRPLDETGRPRIKIPGVTAT